MNGSIFLIAKVLECIQNRPEIMTDFWAKRIVLLGAILAPDDRGAVNPTNGKVYATPEEWADAVTCLQISGNLDKFSELMREALDLLEPERKDRE